VTGEPAHWVEYAFPLAGLTTDMDDGLVGDVLVARPTLEEWRFLEKTDVAYRIVLPGIGGIAVAPPPICIYVHRPLDEPPVLDDGLPDWNDAFLEADDLVCALWLHKPGDLPPPEQACLYRYTSEGMYSRIPGPYRQALQEQVPGDAYVLGPEDVEPVAKLGELRRRFRTEVQNVSGDIALGNLRQSHGWYLAPGDRLALLFAGLEALLGGYRNSSEFGGTPMPRRAALAAHDPAVERYLTGAGRRLRNAVAHGNAPQDEEHVDRVRAIVCSVIVSYLEFCVQERPASRPTDAFNLALTG
jgi:hypothetical protein